MVKACVSYFLSNFSFFHQVIAFQKLWKMFFISSNISQDIQIFVVFSFPFHTFQIQNDKLKWNNLNVMNWLA